MLRVDLFSVLFFFRLFFCCRDLLFVLCICWKMGSENSKAKRVHLERQPAEQPNVDRFAVVVTDDLARRFSGETPKKPTDTKANNG